MIKFKNCKNSESKNIYIITLIIHTHFFVHQDFDASESRGWFDTIIIPWKNSNTPETCQSISRNSSGRLKENFSKSRTLYTDDTNSKDSQSFKQSLADTNSYYDSMHIRPFDDDESDHCIDDGRNSFCDDVYKEEGRDSVGFEDHEIVTQDNLSTPSANRRNSTATPPPFLVDVFRALHCETRDAFTVWNTKERARETNYGTRIDYVLATRALYETKRIAATTNSVVNSYSCCEQDSNQQQQQQNQQQNILYNDDNIGTSDDSCSNSISSNISNHIGCFETCVIRSDVYGSDHCPVECSLDLKFKKFDIVSSSAAIPSSCAVFMPELCGKQQKIKSYFTVKQSSESLLKNSPRYRDGVKRSFSSFSFSEEIKSVVYDSSFTLDCSQTNNNSDLSSSIAISSTTNCLSTINNKSSFTSTVSSLINRATKRPRNDRSEKSNMVTDNRNIRVRNKSISSFFSGSSSDARSQTEDRKYRESHDHKRNQLDLLDMQFEQISRKQSRVGNQNRNKSPVNNTKGSVDKQHVWKGIFKGPEPSPLCSGHKEKCVLQTVKKEGPNIGRQFYCCNRPSGHTTNKEARCKYFKWKIAMK